MTLDNTTVAAAHNIPPNETLYHLLFQNSLDGLMLTAPDGSIFDANPAACRIMGRTREEILAEGRQGLIDASDPQLAVLVAERQRMGRAHGQLRARRKDGTLFPIEISSVVFQSPLGELRTCIIIRDITERRASEAEREKLIHELKEALGRVKSISGLLPMCASCRKIRDQKGSWHDLETYIRSHTEADFSHGICPDCRQKLYPETIRS
jgi:PAS domain S-box-containing protein